MILEWLLVPTYYGTQRAYQIISGSDGKSYNSGSGGTGYTTPGSGSYGLFLPDIGTIIIKWRCIRFGYSSRWRY